MTLLQLVTALRRDILDDEGGDILTSWTTDDTDCLWTNVALTDFLNDALREYCDRRAIKDSSTAAVCTITLADGTADYTLHDSIISIEEVILSTTGEPIEKLFQEDFDYSCLNDLDELKYYAEDINARQIRLYMTPDSTLDSETLTLTVRRGTLVTFDWSGDQGAEPDIPARYHRHLIYWAASRAYLLNDADTFDKEKAGFFQGQFTQMVGPRRTVQEQHIRKRNANTPLRTKGYYF